MCQALEINLDTNRHDRCLHKAASLKRRKREKTEVNKQIT